MTKERRASERATVDMDWRIDLIRKSHMRLLGRKAADIETQQARAKTARADERKHVEEQKQTKSYILAILSKRTPKTEQATA